MANNVTVATDDVAGVHYQNVKLTDATEDSTTPTGVAANPLKVAVHDGTTLATVRNLAANDALNVAIVDGAGDQITTFGGGTQYTEDAAAAANPVGTAPILVRADTPAGVVSADGDNIAQRATNYGAAFVQVVDSSGSFVDTFGGGTQYTEDAVAAANPVGPVQILVRADTPAGIASADGDNVAQRGTDYGAAFVQVVDSSGAFVDTFGGGTEVTEDAVSAANPTGGQVMARRRDALSGETSADGDVVALNATDKGELYVKHVDAIPVTDNGGSFSVDDGGGSITVDNGGTFAVQATLATGASGPQKSEDVAFDDADVGIPAMAVRKATPANTSDADGDYEMLQMSAGRLWTSATIDNASGGSAVNIQDGGNSITVDNGGTFAVQAAQSGNWTVRVSDGTDTADVLDLANSNPLTVAIVDASGDQITSFGGGTQYTEDAPAAGNPTGTAPILVRADTPAGVASTDGDNVAQRGTNYGAAFVQVLNSSGSFVDSFGGGTEVTEDAPAAGNPTGGQIMARRRDALAGETSTDGDVVAANATDKGELYVKHVDAIPVTDNGGNLSIDDGGNSITVDNGGTFAVQVDGAALTALQLIDNIVQTEDAPHNSGDSGVMMLGVRQDSLTTLAGDGDYIPIAATQYGQLKVSVAGQTIEVVTPTGPITPLYCMLSDVNGIEAVKREDDASANLDGGVPILATRKATPANTSGADGDYEFLQMSAGRLWTSSTIDAALPAGTNAIGKLAANSGVDIGDVDVTSVPPATILTGSGSLTGSGQAVTLTLAGRGNAAFQLTGTWVGTITFEASVDGSTWEAIYAYKAGDNLLSSTATANDIYRTACAGFANVRARCSAYTSGTIVVTAVATEASSTVILNSPLPPGTAAIGTVTAVGDVAHDTGNSGNPVQIGVEAIAHGTNPTAVTAGDRTKLYANRAGIPFVIGGHPNVITIEVATTGAQTDVAIVTVSAGTKIVVTQVQVTTDNANTAFPQIRVGFGTANTPTTTGVVLSHPGLPAGGGTSRGDGSGIIGIGADNEDLRYTCGAPTGGSLRVVVTYYTIES